MLESPCTLAQDDHQEHLSFLHQALKYSDNSNDPNTRVGAILVDENKKKILGGWNRFPTGIRETHERMQNRDVKLKMVVHAEMACLLEAYDRLIPIRGATLYLACTDETGEVWSGPPCAGNCAKHLIQAGIARVIGFPPKPITKWKHEIEISSMLLAEAGVQYREIPVPLNYQHHHEKTSNNI